jgi:hypothetical protein
MHLIAAEIVVPAKHLVHTGPQLRLPALAALEFRLAGTQFGQIAPD